MERWKTIEGTNGKRQKAKGHTFEYADKGGGLSAT